MTDNKTKDAAAAAAKNDVSQSTNKEGVDAAFDKALAAGGGASAADHGTQTDLTAISADAKVTPPIIQTGAMKPPVIGEVNDNLHPQDFVDHRPAPTAAEQGEAVEKAADKK